MPSRWREFGDSGYELSHTRDMTTELPPGPTANPPAQVPPPEDATARGTYRYLRVAPPIIAAFLFTGVAVASFQGWAIQTSISAYYYTPAHSVFIAALCAIGVCLSVNQGNSRSEDILLNFAGFFAFIVAMVPTGAGVKNEAIEQSLNGHATLVYDTQPGIFNNVLAIAVAAVITQIVRAKLSVKAGEPTDLAKTTDPWPRRWFFIGSLVLAVLAAWALFSGPTFRTHGHNVSAVTMFVFILFVMWSNWRATRSDPTNAYAGAYRRIAFALVGTLVLLIGAWFLLGSYTVIVAEFVLIAEFAIFWIVQSRELWDVESRPLRAVTTTP